MGKVKKAVIPAAGLGTRLLPVTKAVPKELLPVGRRPAIQYVVEEAVRAGIEEIVLVSHPSKAAIADYFRPDMNLEGFLAAKGKREEIEELRRIEALARFEVVIQEEPLGLGHAVLCAREAVGGDPFFVMLPDVLIDPAEAVSRRLIESCRGEEWGIVLEEVSPERVSAYGIVRCEAVSGGEYRVTGAVEKPGREDAPSNLSILGRYLFTPEIFDLIEGAKRGALGEIQLTDAIDLLAKIRPGKGVVCRGKVFDVGTPEGLLQAGVYFQKT